MNEQALFPAQASAHPLRTCTPVPACALPAQARLIVVRHGATAPNLAGLRCGGDIDPPLAPEGLAQARHLGLRLAATLEPPELIITSDLRRTRETAELLREALGVMEMHVVTGFRERRLGQWNLCPVADNELQMSAGVTPPGGESRAEFAARVNAALRHVAPLLERRALLVASKGVARVLRERAGVHGAPPLGNAEAIVLQLPLADLFEPTPSPA